MVFKKMLSCVTVCGRPLRQDITATAFHVLRTNRPPPLEVQTDSEAREDWLQVTV